MAFINAAKVNKRTAWQMHLKCKILALFIVEFHSLMFEEKEKSVETAERCKRTYDIRSTNLANVFKAKINRLFNLEIYMGRKCLNCLLKIKKPVTSRFCSYSNLQI